MRRIRGLLLKDYIGAIAIAFLFAQGILLLIAWILNPIQYFAAAHLQSHSASVFGRFDNPPFQWDTFLITIIHSLLVLAAAYLLAHWVYKPEALTSNAQEQQTGDGNAE